MEFGLLRDGPFRSVLLANAAERFGAAALTVLLGFQVYGITHRALDLGWLGLVEAIPGVSLVLYGGHIADRHSRRQIVVAAYACMALLALGFAMLAGLGWRESLVPLFLLAFLFGVVRAFAEPAASGLEAQVVPLARVMEGVALLATTGRLAGVMGPAVGGFAWAALGPAGTYGAIAGLFALSCVAVGLGVPERPAAAAGPEEPALVRIADGVRFVFRDQLLFGSMMLDLFAVFFGGATALLPVFAADILHVGPVGFGLLRSAGAAGSLAAALLAGRFLPQRRAGAALLGVIGGFGVAMVVFGLSRSVPVSLTALFVAGLCDGTSVVIRRAILRLGSPDAMRGRIAAVKSVFVGSSNELGAFESGVAASLLGASAAVWTGGVVTLLIVGVTAWRAPLLRRLDLTEMARVASR